MFKGGKWGGGREAQEGGDVYTDGWTMLIVKQKPTQYCKEIILQLKINFKKSNNLCFNYSFLFPNKYFSNAYYVTVMRLHVQMKYSLCQHLPREKKRKLLKSFLFSFKSFKLLRAYLKACNDLLERNLCVLKSLFCSLYSWFLPH